MPNLVDNRQGLGGVRAGDAHRGGRGAQPGRPGLGPGDASEILNDPQKFAQFQQAQDGLSSALSRLMVVVERYPELKSTAAFRDLMTQLEGTENRIARRAQAVQRGGARLQHAPPQVPDQPVRRASLGWHFQTRPYFEAQAGAETAPKVEFSSR